MSFLIRADEEEQIRQSEEYKKYMEEHKEDVEMEKNVRITVSADFKVSSTVQYTTDKVADGIMNDRYLASAEECLLANVRDAIRTTGGSNFTLTIEEK